MGIFLQTIVNGVMLGSIYAMVALGLTLIYGILNIPNFSHGALYMIGAYVAYFTIAPSAPLTDRVSFPMALLFGQMH